MKLTKQIQDLTTSKKLSNLFRHIQNLNLLFKEAMKINHTILILLALILSSCGYKLQGGGILPGEIKTVSVLVFKNKSSQTGAEIIFTNALIEELMRNSTVKVINKDNPDIQPLNKTAETTLIGNVIADAVIYGTISSISFDALARTSDDVVYKRGVNAVVNLEMKSRTGEIIFAVNKLTENESYTVSGYNSIDETVIKSTLESVARHFARRVVSQMTDNF
jgi:hypothetical protein